GFVNIKGPCSSMASFLLVLKPCCLASLCLSIASHAVPRGCHGRCLLIVCCHQRLNRVAPDNGQGNTNDHQRKAKTHPHSHGSKFQLEAQPRPQRQTDDPIRKQIGEHGCARIPGASECACGDDLHTVKELKDSRHDQQQSTG